MATNEVVDVDASDQDNAALRTPSRSTISIFSGRNGYSKETIQQFRVVIPTQKSPQHRPQVNMAVSPDEARLLGASSKRDPDAIAIGKPGANQGNPLKRKSAIPSGFRPINTLSQSSNVHQVSARSSSFGLPSSHGKKRNQLEIEVSIGDNVKQASQELEWRVSSVGEPQPKRKKHGSSHGSAKSIDPPGSTYSDVSHNRRSPNIIQGLGDIFENHGRPSDRIKDLTKPQKTMGSNKAKTGNRVKFQQTGSEESVILHSPDAGPTQESSEIQLHNDALPPISPPAYKGTARTDSCIALKSRSAARGALQADSDGKSKYFPSDRRSERQSQIKQNRGHNGRAQTSDVRNLSSDELESGTTVGNHAVVNLASSGKRLRSISPAKTLASTVNAPLPKDNFDGLTPSTIPKTNFRVTAKRRQQFMNPPHTSVDDKQKESESWGMGLSSIVGKNSILIKGPDLGLDFNSNYKIYQVQLQGKKQSSDHQIDPKTLLKVVVAEDGTKLRFEYSSSKKIDVEMLKKSDVSLLLQHMRERYVFKIELKSSEWMDKAFARREKENGVSSNPSRASEDELLDVRMAQIKKQPKEDAQYTVTPHDERGSKPPRQLPRQRLLDGMHGGDHKNARDQVGPEQMKPKDPIDDTPAANPNSLDQDPFSISRLTRRIHRSIPNPHLSGSPASLYRSTRQTRQFPTQDGALQSFIRRTLADLGNPWKKPLLFPKDGKKKASVEFSDLERLEEGEFLNDNLIGFYLRYLEQRLEETKPEIAKKVYFFNTFFFASLTNTQRGKRDINYEAVQNWTRSIDLFAFEYIVVPINESAHWYLAIICNLPAILPDFAADKSSAEIKDICSVDPEQHIEDKSVGAAVLSDLPSSPINKVAHMEDARSTVNKSEGDADSEDQAPTASFAEMSLETELNRGSSVINSNITKPKSNEHQSRAEEQGLLDAQINDGLAQVQTFASAPLVSECGEEIQNEEGSVLLSNPTIHVSAKKRKRKSVAPITRRNPNNPAIITFDSLGLTHSPTIRTLKNYLHEEGRAKRGLEWDDASIKGVTAKNIPQQNNLCDCGLFLLGYVDKFLDDPKEFTSKISARQYDVQEDWPRLNPSTLRISIRKQIIDLHEEQQRDQKENAEKRHGKEAHAGKRGNLDDSVLAERGREEPQSPHQTPPSLRSSPQLEIKSSTGMSKKETSETVPGKDAPVSSKSRQAQSPPSLTLLSRERCLQMKTNPRKSLTRREALENASEISAPELQKFSNAFEDEDVERSGFPDGKVGKYVPKAELLSEWDNETNHAAAHDDYSKSEKSGRFNDVHRFRSSPSVDATEVVDHAREAVELRRVIEDSQPDASEENSQNILGQNSFTSTAQGAVRRADEEKIQDFHRLRSTALEAEKQLPREGRLARPAHTLEHPKYAVIEID